MSNISNAYSAFMHLRADLLVCELDARRVGDDSLAAMLGQAVGQVTALQARFVAAATSNHQ